MIKIIPNTNCLTVKTLPGGTPELNVGKCPKIEVWIYRAVMHQKDAYGMATSEDPVQTVHEGAV